ncbi:hypothetical protein AALP_AA3G265400 [Arabis alpina]|uniref:Uncharacterized protein n=1 Tax=Arabis alpina TaxID=50452 RepID=A0A087HBV0_ARAAL|nr:hypothetical protein AALP_AA3G265400 [Arabis alpina]
MKPSSTEGAVYPGVTLSRRADAFTGLSTDDPMRDTVVDGDPMTLPHDPTPRAEGSISSVPDVLQMMSVPDVPMASRSVPVVITMMPTSDDDTRRLASLGDPSATEGPSFVDGMIPLNDEDPELAPGRADVSYSSSSRASCAESDDEDTFVEVKQTRKAKKAKKKARARINPRGIRHLLGIYVLSRECGVVISTEHLSYLTEFRVRGRSEELKHTVTNSSGMALIIGFPSKDVHFEDRFLFVEISERTVEADCIDLVKTRWERRVKPSLPEVSEEFITAMHIELSVGNGNWRKSFSRRRIERALSAEIFPGKILGRGPARMSFSEQAALKVAAKTMRSSGSSASRVVAPMTSSPTAPLVRARPSRPSRPKTLLTPPSLGEVAEFRGLSAERAHVSSGKRKGVDRETPLKRQRVDSFPAAVVGRETSASRVGGVLRDEAYSVVTSKASEV